MYTEISTIITDWIPTQRDVSYQSGTMNAKCTTEIEFWFVFYFYFDINFDFDNFDVFDIYWIEIEVCLSLWRFSRNSSKLKIFLVKYKIK
jgi:hypothetical protein